eukprot:m51a1_g5205 hypothetical protein (185) ;mRNA; f:219754-221029
MGNTQPQPVNEQMRAKRVDLICHRFTHDELEAMYKDFLKKSQGSRRKNGTVDFAEFCAGMSVLCKGRAEEKIAFVFKMFDSDGDGSISVDELRRAVRITLKASESLLSTRDPGLSLEDLSYVTQVNDEEYIMSSFMQAFYENDKNRDRRLQLDEFVRFARDNKEIVGFMDQFDGLYSTSKRKTR